MAPFLLINNKTYFFPGGAQDDHSTPSFLLFEESMMESDLMFSKILKKRIWLRGKDPINIQLPTQSMTLPKKTKKPNLPVSKDSQQDTILDSPKDHSGPETSKH